MYNTDLPTRAELPSSAKLLRSTVLALISALVLLVTIILPSEYAIDPTGIGRVLGLTEMGEIKAQLTAEAAADVQPSVPEAAPQEVAASPAPVQAPSDTPQVELAEPGVTPGRSDEVSFVLTPGEGTEIKLVMKAGATARYQWVSAGGPVNFDTHGDGGGRSISYEKGRGVETDEGELKAAFDGNHGWFWRNRGITDVTVTLKTSGDYEKLKRPL